MPPSFAPSCTMSFGHLSARPEKPRRERARNAATPAASDSAPSVSRRVAVAPVIEAQPRSERCDPAPAATADPRSGTPARQASKRPGGRSPRGEQAIARRLRGDSVHLRARGASQRAGRRQERADCGRVEEGPSAIRAGNRFPGRASIAMPHFLELLQRASRRRRRANRELCCELFARVHSAPSADSAQEFDAYRSPRVTRAGVEQPEFQDPRLGPGAHALSESFRGGPAGNERLHQSRSRTQLSAMDARGEKKAHASATVTAATVVARPTECRGQVADRDGGGQRDRRAARARARSGLPASVAPPLPPRKSRAQSGQTAAGDGAPRHKQAAGQSRAIAGSGATPGSPRRRQPARREAAPCVDG